MASVGIASSLNIPANPDLWPPAKALPRGSEDDSRQLFIHSLFARRCWNHAKKTVKATAHTGKKAVQVVKKGAQKTGHVVTKSSEKTEVAVSRHSERHIPVA